MNSIGTGKGLCPSLSQKSKVKEEVQEAGLEVMWVEDSPLNSIGTGKGLCPSLSQKSKVKEEVQQYGARGGQDRAGARGDVGRGQPLELDWYRRIPGGGEGGALWLRST